MKTGIGSGGVSLKSEERIEGGEVSLGRIRETRVGSSSPGGRVKVMF